MKISQISVHAGRKFNHPYESYSNLSSGLTITMDLAEQEDHVQAIELLQSQAEQLIEEHKQHMLQQLEILHENAQIAEQVAGAESALRRMTAEVEQLRRRQEGLQLPSPQDRRCRVCGCTDDDCKQCIEKTGKPCFWVEDDLCSACADEHCEPF